MARFAQVVGEVLRDARRERGLTLRQVSEQSQGRFKPSVIGGYERGERSISLARFTTLAEFYGVPADRLLSRVMERLDPAGRRRTVLDLGRLETMDQEPGQAVTTFIGKVRRERGDPAEDVITLRAGDLEAVALTSGIDLERLLAALRPVLRGDGR
ncbi:MAG: helix-turn-helix domain-containing protein [Actinomycetota bacterium]